MKTTMVFFAAILVMPSLPSTAFAGVCTESVAQLQREMDTVIDEWAGSGPWAPESLDALRGHQPTPYTIAAARNASDFEQALDSLDLARAADRSDDVLACNKALASVRAELRRYGR